MSLYSPTLADKLSGSHIQKNWSDEGREPRRYYRHLRHQLMRPTALDPLFGAAARNAPLVETHLV
jgi:hypothetical protein